MKKFYVYALALGVSMSASAQSTFDFESHTLAAESYDNGSGGGGDFTFSSNEDIGLYNYYDTSGGWWLGFSISNITDNTTPGWGNQYSAYPGSGAGASSNYAVFYSSGSIYGSAPTTVFREFKITNTTYAALSMRDGDMFGKEFGSIYDAQGNIDGTNGEDYFRVWIIGENTAGEKDSLEYYLADYRFPDSTQDYIVDTWETIDLSSLSILANKLSFRFESSDMDSIWINTPTYFAIDDLKTDFVNDLNTIEQAQIRVFPNPANDVVTIVGGVGTLSVSDLSGRIVYQDAHNQQSTIPVQDLTPSVYVIRLESASGSYTNQLIVH